MERLLLPAQVIAPDSPAEEGSIGATYQVSSALVAIVLLVRPSLQVLHSMNKLETRFIRSTANKYLPSGCSAVLKPNCGHV